jgi:hypothetical protein
MQMQRKTDLFAWKRQRTKDTKERIYLFIYGVFNDLSVAQNI